MEATEARDELHATRLNGLDVDLLRGAAEELSSHSEAAKVTIRTRHRWDNGFAVDGYAHELEEAGEVTPRAFSFRTDWPPEIGGQDTGPSPGETILGALGGCVAMTYITKAATRGVDIEELEVMIEAQVDLRGVFELDAVRAGLTGAIVTVRVRSDADDGILDELGRIVTRASGVYDTFVNPVPVQLDVQRMS
jgi:uncharacterized OsmC-like protein